MSPASRAGTWEFSFTNLLILPCGEDSPGEGVPPSRAPPRGVAHSARSSLHPCCWAVPAWVGWHRPPPRTPRRARGMISASPSRAWGVALSVASGKAKWQLEFSGTQACGRCLCQGEREEEEVCCIELELGHRVSWVCCTHGFLRCALEGEGVMDALSQPLANDLEMKPVPLNLYSNKEQRSSAGSGGLG